MAVYTAKAVTVNATPEQIANKFKDLTALQPMLDKLPEDQRSQLGDITLHQDSIVLGTKQVGNITLRCTHAGPEAIHFKAEGSPVAMNLEARLTPEGDDKTQIVTALDVDIPMMLKPMLSGTMQKVVDGFGQMIGSLA